MNELLRELVDEAASIAADAKRAVGHQDHDGFRAEDNFRRIYCGCGALLIDVGEQVTRVSYPATTTVTFEVVDRRPAVRDCGCPPECEHYAYCRYRRPA